MYVLRTRNALSGSAYTQQTIAELRAIYSFPSKLEKRADTSFRRFLAGKNGEFTCADSARNIVKRQSKFRLSASINTKIPTRFRRDTWRMLDGGTGIFALFFRDLNRYKSSTFFFTTSFSAQHNILASIHKLGLSRFSRP